MRVVPEVSGRIYKETLYNNSDKFIFFCVISENFSALIAFFLQLLYSSLVQGRTHKGSWGFNPPLEITKK